MALLIILLPSLAFAQAKQISKTKPIAFINVTVVDVASGITKPEMTVVITDNRISAVGTAKELRLPKGTQKIDARGKFLIPGLWDMHVHLSHFGEYSLPLFLANGVTGVRDMGDGFAQVKSWRDGIAAGTRLGPRVKAASPIFEDARWIQAVRAMNRQLGIKSPDRLGERVGIRGEEDARKYVDEFAQSGADFIKIRTNVSRETFLAIADEAKKRGLPLVGHMPGGVSLAEASDAGMADIEHNISLPSNLNREEREKLFRRLAANHTAVVPTLLSTQKFRLLPESVVNAALNPNGGDLRIRYIKQEMLEEWREGFRLQKLETPPFDWQADYQSQIRDVREMAALGVNIMAGTDTAGALVFPGFSLHEELALLVKDGGLTPLQALQSATINPVKFLGLSDSLGAVEAGKIADLVLLDANPLEDIGNTQKIDAVVANGKYLPKKELQKMLVDAQAAASLLTATNSAQENLSPPFTPLAKSKELIAQLEKSIPQLMKDGEVPGLSIAIIKDAKILWQQSFGVANSATKQPVAENTIFEAASLSKPVFAYAVLKLIEKGKLDLDVPLVKYLPKPYLETDERANLITARMVLSHTTGFPNWAMGQPLKTQFNPGERFSYSGEGFVYLQKVVEHLTGKPLNAVMQKEVFEPLGMPDSSFVWMDKYETLKATGHNSVGAAKPLRKYSEAIAAGSLHTTTADYAKFVIAIMNGTGLKKETLNQMLSQQTKVDEGCSNCIANKPTGKLSNSIFWGLGWGLQQTANGKSFWHWGDNNGDTHCFVIASEKQKSGVLIFTDSGNGHSIIPAIVEQVMGGKQPLTAWINYEPYNSPAKNLLRAILSEGIEAPLKRYLEERTKDDAKRLNEVQINALGYALLERKRTAEAIEIFKLNVADFPNSGNTYDSLAETYLGIGEKELALKFYKKALEINPNYPNAKAATEVVKKLEAELKPN
ncbi:MAG TPA: serine hydrolase [Pyrinomonadaceae bacterium]